MKKSLTIFLQVVIVLIALGAVAFLLWEPQVEGVNVNATNFEIYFKDPFLAYAYTGSIAFFTALYQAFKAIGYVRKNMTYSQETSKALRTIKYCAITLIAFVLGAEAYIVTIQRKIEDDIAGGVAMGVFMILISIIVAVTAKMFEYKLIKENIWQ